MALSVAVPRRIRPDGFPGWSLVDLAPRVRHRATVIWLHGLGADGYDFLPALPALRLPESLGLRFLFPEAPPRPVSLNGGLVMRAWYDIRSLDREGHADREQLAASVAGLRALIRQENERGIPPERIALVGFSQGGGVVLQTVASAGPGGEPPPRVAGALGMSTYLPFPEAMASAASPPVPILLGHGTEDEVVGIHLGVRTRDLLRQRGWEVEFRTWPIGHAVSEAELRDAGRFLRRILAPLAVGAGLAR